MTAPSQKVFTIAKVPKVTNYWRTYLLLFFSNYMKNWNSISSETV